MTELNRVIDYVSRFSDAEAKRSDAREIFALFVAETAQLARSTPGVSRRTALASSTCLSTMTASLKDVVNMVSELTRDNVTRLAQKPVHPQLTPK